jgi:hypothetical protein
MVQQGEDFLCFAHGKNGNEDGPASFKSLTNPSQKCFFEKGAILSRNGGLGTSGGFHNQSVKGAGGVLAGEHKSLALKIEIACVESSLIFRTNFSHDGARHVSCIMKYEFESGGVDSDRPI